MATQGHISVHKGFSSISTSIASNCFADRPFNFFSISVPKGNFVQSSVQTAYTAVSAYTVTIKRGTAAARVTVISMVRHNPCQQMQRQLLRNLIRQRLQHPYRAAMRPRRAMATRMSSYVRDTVLFLSITLVFAMSRTHWSAATEAPIKNTHTLRRITLVAKQAIDAEMHGHLTQGQQLQQQLQHQCPFLFL